MDMGELIGAVITGAVLTGFGAALQMFAYARRHIREIEAQRLARRETRAEQAGGEILESLVEIRRSFEDLREPGDEPEGFEEVASKLTRLAAVITEAGVRRALSRVIEALDFSTSVATFEGDRPWLIARRACGEAEELVGAWMRGQDELPATPRLDRYHAAVEEDMEAQEEARRQFEAERRQNGP
jgi:hypothetical protein